MFFRKHKNKEPSSVLKEEPKIIDKETLLQEAENLSNTIDSVEGEERIKVLRKIGSLYFQADKIDDAIKYYEISISENKSLGRAYTDLVKLYNIKRKQAISVKDYVMVKHYMDKTDELLQLSKDVIRGKG
ncbi:hypothetical protein [Clostridium akagii]|uniref:hypothetical protein n=1 Tax=Clostridium akagii TaxID=91623 RepID=UPI00047C2723|nr:hypothetical protein [Clostridium akagii]